MDSRLSQQTWLRMGRVKNLTIDGHVAIVPEAGQPTAYVTNADDANAIVRLPDLVRLLKEVKEEICLVRTKDGVTYDPTLVSRIDLMLQELGE